ncbi:MAG: DUF2971 domain-containing protein [Flavobacterium sp.]|nr:MAG: DUF2971 domain-containing protein [Flavobacterium sp.]
MKVTAVDLDNLDNIHMPQVTYKYRTWKSGSSHNDNVLLRNQLFMAYPNDFEDELDCKIPTSYNLMNEDEKLEWCERILRRTFTRYSNEAIKREAQHYFKLDRFNDEAWMKRFEADEWELYNMKAGVLSLCLSPFNEHMWEKYSLQHTGICYGFNTKKLLTSIGASGWGNIDYCKELPVIHPNDDVMEQATARAFHKLERWSIEEEYRIRTFDEANADVKNRIITFPNDALEFVILGKDFNNNELPEVIDILIKKGATARIYQCAKMSGELTVQIINY